MKAPAPAAGAGRTPQTGLIPVRAFSTLKCSPSGCSKQKLTVGAQISVVNRKANTQGPCEAMAPTLSHPFTLTFHLQNQTVLRPTCNAKTEGQNSHPTWESLDWDPQGHPQACESGGDTCGPASQCRGVHDQRSSGLGGNLPMNHGSAEPPLGRPRNPPKDLVCVTRGQGSCTILM